MERPKQSLSAAGIIGTELPRIETGVCHVAASPAGNLYFRQISRPTFENGDPVGRGGLGAVDRRKKAGGATANNHDAALAHAAEGNPMGQCNSTFALKPRMKTNKHECEDGGGNTVISSKLNRIPFSPPLRLARVLFVFIRVHSWFSFIPQSLDKLCFCEMGFHSSNAA